MKPSAVLKPTKPTIIDIYCRVSTDEQAGSGLSMDHQERQCLSYLEHQQVTIGKVFREEGRSGKDFNRDEFKKMHKRLEGNESQGICIYKLDRLSRSVIDLITFSQGLQERSQDLMVVHERIDTSTPGGRMFFMILSVFAQFERELISDRTKKAMQMLVANGFFAGGHVPAGLIAIPVPASQHKVLAECPQYGQIVAKIWAMVIGGSSLLDVARYLDSHQVPAGDGPWDKVKVSRILRNPKMKGILVNESAFAEADIQLSRRACPLRPDGRVVHQPPKQIRPMPLRNLVRCAICGSTMVSQMATGRRGDKYPYLVCTGKLKKGQEFCSAPGLNADLIEPQVLAVLRSTLSNDIQAALAEFFVQQEVRRSPLQDELRKVGMERDKVQASIDRLLTAIQDGTLPNSVAGPRLQTLAEEADGLSARMTRLERELALTNLSRETVQEAISDLKAGVDNLKDMASEDVGALLSSFITEIRLARTVEEMVVHFDFSPIIGVFAAKNGETLPEPDRVSHNVTLGDLDGT